MRIGLDAMGGDNAPVEIVKGAVESLSTCLGTMVLFGDDSVKEELKKYEYDQSRIEVVYTSEQIDCDADPLTEIRRKKDSSMVVGFKYLKEEKIDAFLSAGSTGAVLAGGLFKVGRIKGIDRPALTTVFPTPSGMFILADIGANTECKAINYLQFGIMGRIYAKSVLGIENASVGLINIGTESTKGTPEVKEAYKLLASSSINFIGNVESRDLFERKADVLITDGFTGNIILKHTEGMGITAKKELKNIVLSSVKNKLAAWMLKPSLKQFKNTLDYKEYGGAPLLGINRPLVKAHGSSDAKAIQSAIKYAEKYVTDDIIGEIIKNI